MNTNITAAKVDKGIKTGSKIAKDNTKELAILALTIAGIYLLYKSVNKAVDNIPTIGNKPGDGGGTVTMNGNTNPPGATITPNQAQTIAAGLHAAMVVWNGTDEQRIFSLLDGKNPIDYVMISNAFGKPKYDDFGDAYFPFPAQNLTYWLNSELDESEMQHLKQIMPGVF